MERAVRTVPRHLFLPEETVGHAYAAERSLVTRRDEHGIGLSSVSAARIQAFMLERAPTAVASCPGHALVWWRKSWMTPVSWWTAS